MTPQQQNEVWQMLDRALSFDALLASAARLQQELEQAAATTTLPQDVDPARVEEIALALMREASE